MGTVFGRFNSSLKHGSRGVAAAEDTDVTFPVFVLDNVGV